MRMARLEVYIEDNMIKISMLSYMNQGIYGNTEHVSDYQMDMVYHGLRSLPDVDVQFLPNPYWMMKSFKNAHPEEIRKIWGKGFTLYGLLDDPKQNFEVEDSDLIIVGLHHTMCNNQQGLYQVVREMVKAFGKEKVCVVDGSDRTEYSDETANLCTYFKRELLDDRTTAKPIFFATPEEQFYPTIPDKSESKRKYEFSPIIPANFCWNSEHTNNYFKFDDEDNYYEHYRQSYFALNCKKGGWQVGRLGEIIANNCLPFFTDLEVMPKNTWHNLPRQILTEVKRIKGVLPNTLKPYNPELDTFIGDTREIGIGSGGSIDWNDFDVDMYYLIVAELKKFFWKNLTTKALGKYILSEMF